MLKYYKSSSNCEGKNSDDVWSAVGDEMMDFMVDGIEWSCPDPNRNRENSIRIPKRAFSHGLKFILLI